MKKYILMLSTLLPFYALADDNLQPTSGTCGTNCTWTMEGNTLTLTGYGNIDNQTRYAQPWYWNRENITSVVIQNAENTTGFKRIGQHVFEDMDYITTVTLPDTLKTIGIEAFNACSHLKNINIPDSVEKISGWAFNNNDINSLQIPANLTKLEDYVFSANPIHELVIPENITEISEHAFYCDGCWSTLHGQAMPLEKIYCSTNMLEACRTAVSHFEHDVEIAEYQKYGDAYYFGGKFYKTANDIYGKNHIKKRIYTIDEANRVAGDKNRVSIRYR